MPDPSQQAEMERRVEAAVSAVTGRLADWNRRAVAGFRQEEVPLIARDLTELAFQADNAAPGVPVEVVRELMREFEALLAAMRKTATGRIEARARAALAKLQDHLPEEESRG